MRVSGQNAAGGSQCVNRIKNAERYNAILRQNTKRKEKKNKPI
jgi:hypothetical protein